MSSTRDLADLLDSAGEVKAERIDSHAARKGSTGRTDLGLANHEQVAVDASGNLDVTGSVAADSLNINGVQDAGWISQLINTGTGSDANGLLVKAGVDASDYVLRLQEQDGTEVLAAKHGGKVGVGTNNPVRTLHLLGNDGAPSGSASGNSDTQLFIENAGSNGAMIEINTDNNSTGRIMFGDNDASNVGRIEYAHTPNRFDIRVNGGSVENKRIREEGEDFRTPGICLDTWTPTKTFTGFNWNESGYSSTHTGTSRWIRVETPQFYSNSGGGGWAQFDLAFLSEHATHSELFSWKMLFGNHHGKTFTGSSTGITKLATSNSYSPYNYTGAVTLYGGTGSDAAMRYLYIKVDGISYFGGSSNAAAGNNKRCLTIDGVTGHIDHEYIITDLGRLSSAPSNLTGVLYSA